MATITLEFSAAHTQRIQDAYAAQMGGTPTGAEVLQYIKDGWTAELKQTVRGYEAYLIQKAEADAIEANDIVVI